MEGSLREDSWAPVDRKGSAGLEYRSRAPAQLLQRPRPSGYHNLTPGTMAFTARGLPGCTVPEKPKPVYRKFCLGTLIRKMFSVD